MTKLLVDTNVYIDYYTSGKFADIIYSRSPEGVIYISAVVVMELLSGAFAKNEFVFTDNMVTTAKLSKKFIVPLWDDYVEAGKLLAKLQSQKGYEIKKTLGLTNDVLIALSARRLGATVITQNRKDFEAIQSVKDFKLKIVG